MSKLYYIGISGGSGSGKSTLCETLESELTKQGLRVAVFHMDDYFKMPEERPRAIAPFTGIEYRDDNHPSTVRMDELKADISAATDEFYDVVIIEGLLVLWDPDIYHKLHLKLFVDCRSEERVVRRLRRNMAWGMQFDDIANVYLDMVRYRHDEYVEPTRWRADLIINGSVFSKLATDMIVNSVAQQVKSN